MFLNCRGRVGVRLVFGCIFYWLLCFWLSVSVQPIAWKTCDWNDLSSRKKRRRTGAVYCVYCRLLYMSTTFRRFIVRERQRRLSPLLSQMSSLGNAEHWFPFPQLSTMQTSETTDTELVHRVRGCAVCQFTLKLSLQGNHITYHRVIVRLS